jgi:type VI secretion system protein ImpG
LRDKLRVEHFKLGCVPAINLFEQDADPEVLKRKTAQNHIVPDARKPDSYEVHTVLEVESTPAGGTEARSYAPFFALGHFDESADDVAFWHAERVESQRDKDHGTEVYLTLVDPKGMPTLSGDRHVLTVRGLFFNRDMASKLPYKDPKGDLRAREKPEFKKIQCLTRPTDTLRPMLRSDSQWRIVSSLSLNHLSLTGTEGDATAGLRAFREILSAHDFIDDERTKKRRSGLVAMSTRVVTRRLPRRGPARGLEITLEFEESSYVGSGLYLFAAVLERFLAAYTSINSFTQCVAKVRGREGTLKVWEPRFGEQVYA